MAADDYKVGYGRPPMNTRFRPGRSGNPRGRPKGSKNYKTLLANILDRKVKRERRRVPRTKLLLEMLVDRALEGDWQAMKLVVSMMEVHDTLREPVSFGKKDAVDFDAMASKFGQRDSVTQASVDTRTAGRGPHAGKDNSYYAEMAARFGNGPPWTT
jgi:hypothetical protein